MIFVLFVGFLFLSLGYTMKLIFKTIITDPVKMTADDNVSQLKQNPESVKWHAGFFDSLSVLIGDKSNQALEEIFDIIIERYVTYWYNTLSTDPGFLIQVRMYLQFMSASLISRLKSIDLTEFSVKTLIPSVFNHVEHIWDAMSRIKGTALDPMLEENVLRLLGPHLHICMASRSSELAYLRALVNRLLPYVSQPPALIPPRKVQTEQPQLYNSGNSSSYGLRRTISSRGLRPSNRSLRLGSDNPFQRSASIGTLSSRQLPWIKLDANRGAYSFLIEILSTCVLLPGMDAVANPDFVNKLILSCLENNTDSEYIPTMESTMVPVLNNYVQEWKLWMEQKPLANVRLDHLLQQQDDLYPFTQYMKSVQSVEPLTALLLMNDIDRRVRCEPLPPDSCQQLHAQICHILALIRGSTHPAIEQNIDEADLDSNENKPQRIFRPSGASPNQESHEGRLFNASVAFDDLLSDVIRKPEPHALVRMVRTQLWQETYHAVYEAVEKRFLPMYVESPEYLCHVFGISQWIAGPCPGSPKPIASSGPEGSRPLPGPSLFGNSLKSMFHPTHAVEGHLMQDLATSSNRPQARLSSRSTKQTTRGTHLRDRIAEASSGVDHTLSLDSALTAAASDPHHQLHFRYLLQSHQVDMSDWNVYIPGLSRPEVHPPRRLIDQLTSTGPSNSITGRDTDLFRMRRFDDIPSSLSEGSKINVPRAPQLSPQYMFTVRTEEFSAGVRRPIARVDRKYAEFYVLEQKLLEFHGNAIGKQLPRRQFAPRTFEFMEAKREEFEDYLQFLLSQSFLRNSELLFTFLTSKTPFTSNLLSELNLGRLVKSVPLKLAKEKGQFLDDFLVSFYISCSPQPIILEPVEPRPKSANNTVITVLPSSGVGTLGGIDALASPDHYSIQPDSARSRSDSIDLTCGSMSSSSIPGSYFTRSVSKNTSDITNVTVSNATVQRSAQCTTLDSRLRSRAYWNNAGWSGDRRKEMTDRVCESPTLQWNSIFDLLLFLLRQLTIMEKPLSVDTRSVSETYGDGPTEHKDNGTAKDARSIETFITLTPPPPPIDPWDVSHAGWSEAFLNGPLTLDQLDTNLSRFSTGTEATSISPVSGSNGTTMTELHHDLPLSSHQSRPQISISWSECHAAFLQSCRIVLQYLRLQCRYFILWVAFQLWCYFRVPVDRWLSSYLVNYLHDCLKDGYTAYALQLLKTTIFFPYTPSTDEEKNERRERALKLLQQTISNLSFAFISNRQWVEDHLSHLFLCFQHPKWNKQLSYVLLDHLVNFLFPEVRTASEAKQGSDNL